MAANEPDDEFERILQQCRQRLSEIDLRLPEIDPAPPRASLELLDVEPAPDPTPLRLVPPPSEPERQPHAAPPQEERQSRLERDAPPAPAGRGYLRWAAVAAAAFILASSVGYWLSRQETGGLSLTFDRIDALGSVPGGGKMAVAAGRTVTVLDADGRVVETRTLDASVAAIASSGGSLWTADGRTPALVEHRADGKATSFALNHIPVAIDADEKYLWSADAKGKIIRQFLITRSMLGVFLQPLDLYDLPQFTVACFAMDSEGVLWLVAAPSRDLYRLKPEGTAYKPTTRASLTPIIGDAGRIQGIALEDGTLWILVAPRDGKGAYILRRLSQRRLRWTPA